MSRWALHWTERKGQSTFYLQGRQGFETLGTEIELFAKLKKGDTVRMVRANPADHLLIRLAAKGIHLEYTYWHALGVEKGISNEQKVLALYRAPQRIFRTLKPDEELGRLRESVALWQQFQHAQLALERIQIGRFLPETVKTNAERFAHVRAILKVVRADIRDLENGSKERPGFVPRVAQNREAQLFAQAAAMKNPWRIAARLLAKLGTLRRFHSVSALWSYSGMGGPKGRNQKGTPGSTGDIKAILASGIVWFTKRNPWRKFYLAAKAYEQQNWERKHPGRKKSTGYVHNLARRKMWKEILKRWFLLVNEIDWKAPADAILQTSGSVQESSSRKKQHRRRPRAKSTIALHHPLAQGRRQDFSLRAT